jgi:hypothetical protein
MVGLTPGRERMVLAHDTDTRRVAFVVGNACSNRFLWDLALGGEKDKIVSFLGWGATRSLFQCDDKRA